MNSIIEGNETLIATLDKQLNERIAPIEHRALLEEIDSLKAKVIICVKVILNRM